MDKITKDKILKMVKNKNFIMVVSVCALTGLTLKVSHAAFFTVKHNTNNQTIRMGNLEVTTNGTTTEGITIQDNIKRQSDEEGLKGPNRVISFQNVAANSLDVNYFLTIGYDVTKYNSRTPKNDTDKLTPLEYVRVAVYDVSDNLVVGPMAITKLPIYESKSDDLETTYTLLTGTLGYQSNTTSTFKIKMWLSENATTSASNSYFYIKSDVSSIPSESNMSYNIHGKLVNSSNTPIANATITLQNNHKFTTDASGVFTLTNMYPGNYNIDILSSNIHYEGNLKIKEGNSLSVIKNNFQGTGESVVKSAYKANTTIDKLLKINPSLKSSKSTLINGTAYNVMSSFTLTGISNKEINNLTIKLGDANSNNPITDITL